MNIYTLLIGIFWLIFLIVWIIAGFTAKKAIRGANRGVILRIILVLAVIYFYRPTAGGYFSGAKFTTYATHPVLSTIAVVLTGLGIGFAIWARWHIGRNWGMPMSQKHDPALVTTGPYNHVRHPIYSGVLLAFFGSAFLGDPWLIGLFVLFAIYFIYSATQEEKMLVKQFPDTYPAYKVRTKMLVPWVF